MRLIDADELMEHVWRDKLDSRELIAEMIVNAPTIKDIPTTIPIDIFKQLLSQHPNEKVLDEIRAEIEKTTSRYTISRERGAMGQVEWSDRLIKESEILQIIDKYKAESEKD